MPLKVLFVCSRNRLRSPTAECVFADWPGVETASAGTAPDADVTLSAELVAWADLVFVMEPVHRSRLTVRYGQQLARTRVVCLAIRDDYDFMDPNLVALLRTRVEPYLPRR